MDIIQKSYNAKRAQIFGKKPTKIDRLILTRSDIWVHTEIQFSERYNKISFSFTLRDGAKGARFKDIKYSHQAERWDNVIIPCTDTEEDKIYHKAESLIGTPYDLIGIIGFATPFNIIKPHAVNMWCTRGCTVCICEAKIDYGLFLCRILTKIDEKLALKPDEGQLMAMYYFRR